MGGQTMIVKARFGVLKEYVPQVDGAVTGIIF
jgi:hypothetical protein